MPTNYIVWQTELIPNFGHQTPPQFRPESLSLNFEIEAHCSKPIQASSTVHEPWSDPNPIAHTKLRSRPKPNSQLLRYIYVPKLDKFD